MFLTSLTPGCARQLEAQVHSCAEVSEKLVSHGWICTPKGNPSEKPHFICVVFAVSLFSSAVAERWRPIGKPLGLEIGTPTRPSQFRQLH